MKILLTLWILSGAIGGFGILPSAQAQAQPKAHIAIPTIAAKPENVGSPEAIVKADYESISGGVGVPRQWARDLTLYDPNARSFTISRNSKTGALAVWTPTEQEFADATDAHAVKAGFTERELAHKIYRFGNVATVLSSYEGREQSTGKIVGGGVNIYQLYYAGGRWWIASVSWDSEHEINPIPPELQPQE